MKKTLFLLSALIFLVCSCDDDNMPTMPEPEPEPGFTMLDVVTGLDYFDENGAPIGLWKTPNDRPGIARAFPNPNLGVVSILSMKNINRIWLIPSTCMIDTITENIPELSQSLSFEITALEEAQIKDISLSESSLQLSLDLSDTSTGFYKLFYQIEETEEIFWQNIYSDPNGNSIPEFTVLDDICN